MHFIIQNNIHQNDLNRMIESINYLGFTYETFFHVPFSDYYPDLGNQKIFVYAASNVTDKIYSDHKEFKGVFAHTNDINLKTYFENTPELMWNKPKIFDTVENLYHMDFIYSEYFIRPILDNKFIAGSVMNKNEIKEWLHKLILLKDTDINNTVLMLSKVNPPQSEYRLFMIDGEVITSSMYRENMKTKLWLGSPKEVKAIAKKFCKNNSVPRACVVDVAVQGDTLGIIEVNSINNSGIYDANMVKLFEKLARI